MNFTPRDRTEAIIWTLALLGAGALIIVMMWAAW
jgi:hypothetical protein